MHKETVYIYNGTEYSSVFQVRKAIYNNERKAFGTPKTVEDWAKLGVVKQEKEVEDVVPEQPVIPDEQLAREIRHKRDRLLEQSDFYIMPDYPSTEEGLETFKTYRQALRDITKQKNFPKEVTWPDRPTVLGEADDV